MLRMIRRGCLVCLLISLFWFSFLSEAQGEAIDFAHEIVPILKQHCAECHSGEQSKGGFSINRRALFFDGEAAVAGDAGRSLFIELIESLDPENQMPPEEKPRVSLEEIRLLRQWVNEGLTWEAGFTFGEVGWEPPLRPRLVDLPPARGERLHPIDRILDRELASREVPIPERTSDGQFLRRVTQDAIGLLPSPEELAEFQSDPTPGKRSLWIEKVLADEVAYADHWLTFWNDLLRNDYTGTGFITKGRTQITTWLYAALRENTPYDQFVRELMAPPTDDSAGFINGIKWRGEVNSSQTREIQFAQNISQVFLGINLKCASCHDSFIDRWKLEEAYNLAAIFSERPLELNRCDKPTGVIATPKWLFPELGEIQADLPKSDRLQQLAELMTHEDNGRFTRTVVNRIWHRLMGRGIVHPVDAMGTKPWSEDLLDYLALRFSESGYDLREFIRFVMTSEAYQSRSVILRNEPGEDYFYAGPIAKRMTAEQFLDSIWQITQTNPAQAEAKVDRVIKSGEGHQNGLNGSVGEITAKWIWHQGEVGTESELRFSLELEAEPQFALLMATCDNAFVMRIGDSRVARSRNWMEPVYLDITKFLRTGENSIEVDAEMFGGAYGFVCQLLIQETNGRLLTVKTDRHWEARPPGGVWAAAQEVQPHGSGPWGKILDVETATIPSGPTPPVRAALVKNDFLMRSLGRPHRDQVVTTRPGELTTLQAIDLANGEILSGYLKEGANQLLGQPDLGNWLFQYALSRSPTEDEQALLADVLGSDPEPSSVEDLLWLVFMQPEFQMIR